MHTIKCNFIKGFISQCQMQAFLRNFRPFIWNVTLLKDFTMTVRSTLVQSILSTRLQLLERNSKDLIYYTITTYFANQITISVPLKNSSIVIMFLLQFHSFLAILQENIPSAFKLCQVMQSLQTSLGLLYLHKKIQCIHEQPTPFPTFYLGQLPP